MELTSHHHWPSKNPETLPELREYLQNHFNAHFTNPNTIREMKQVLEWIQTDSPSVLQWNGADSFSTLFTAFHTGIPWMENMLQRYHLPERLLRFLDAATELERTTEQFAYIEQMEQVKEKDKIISVLRRFIDELPNKENFSSLVESIEPAQEPA